jgi:hypothetical protein
VLQNLVLAHTLKPNSLSILLRPDETLFLFVVVDAASVYQKWVRNRFPTLVIIRLARLRRLPKIFA